MSGTLAGLAGMVFIVGCILAWGTHLVFCISAAAYTGSAIALLIVGLAFFPLGILHGVSIWFGYGWL